jgi:putative sterol carrier protein
MARRLRAFLCHSSRDKATVRALYAKLLDASVDPWFDEVALVPGQDWALEIRRAVKAADAVLVCLSKTAVTGTGFVHKEIGYALDAAEEQPEGSIYLIPVMLEECDCPDRLRRFHWVNLYDHGGFDRLLRSLAVRAASIGPEIMPVTDPTALGSYDFVSQLPEEVPIAITVDDLFREMPRLVDSAAAKGMNSVIQFNFGGNEDRYLTMSDGSLTVSKGSHPAPTMTLTMTPRDFLDMTFGRLTGQRAFMEGKIKITGDPRLAMKMQDLFKRP